MELVSNSGGSNVNKAVKTKISLIGVQATQEKNRMSSEMNEVRDHLDIKDRKISVLQRKVWLYFTVNSFK